MSWRDELIARLAEQPCGGYGSTDGPATEPSAFAALALVGAGRPECATVVARWLAEIQQPSGAVGVRANEAEPCWPTSLAVLVWKAVDAASAGATFDEPRNRAIAWILDQRGVTFSREEDLGHDPGLPAWPWVAGTHAWVEPTALHVLALKSAGYAEHSRTHDAVRVLLDRQLPRGGWNYGNTFVLGRELRFHVQPTSLALLGLATEPSTSRATARSLDLLERSVSPQTTTVSLSWACLALAAQGRPLTQANDWLGAMYQRALDRPPSLHKLALIALASQQESSLLVSLPRQAELQERELK